MNRTRFEHPEQEMLPNLTTPGKLIWGSLRGEKMNESFEKLPSL